MHFRRIILKNCDPRFLLPLFRITISRQRLPTPPISSTDVCKRIPRKLTNNETLCFIVEDATCEACGPCLVSCNHLEHAVHKLGGFAWFPAVVSYDGLAVVVRPINQVNDIKPMIVVAGASVTLSLKCASHQDVHSHTVPRLGHLSEST